MNARQAAKAAAKQLEDLTFRMRRAEEDIRDYNLCIDHMIAGGSPCDYCEDLDECRLQAKGKGCADWMLRYPREAN